MKAGQALGLLAGLGALNALSGGRNGTGQRFTGLLDMLDGGGAGQSGDRFEGGGLLSILGNLFAKPLEAQQNIERIAENTNATNAVTEVLKKAITPEQRASAAIVEENRQRGLLEDKFDPRGPNQMPAMTTASADPYAPLGGSNPAVQAEIARRQAAAAEAQRMMQYEPMGSGGAAAALQAGIEVPTGMLAPEGSGVAPRQPMPESIPMERYMVAPSMIDVQPPRGMNLPQDATMSRAMEALRQRFPNATPEQLANAAAMMGM